jgi:hypothetical protein
MNAIKKIHMPNYINLQWLLVPMGSLFDDTAFCRKCGAAISVRICCTGNTAPPPDLLCGKCGGSDSYSYCGRKAQMDREAKQPTIRSKNKK